jgi:predicted phosphoribosyltransferase
MSAGEIVDLEALRGRTRVFRTRAEAGGILADMLRLAVGPGAVVLGIPAGGVPVAAVLAERLGLSLGAAVVSKITPSWNTELGYGALAFDGTVVMNERMAAGLGLNEEEIAKGIARAREKVARRVRLLAGDRPMPDLAGRTVVLVDDGLATGYTMACALNAISRLRAREKIVAVPTGHREAVERVAAQADAVYCANLRAGMQFAVADAYERWYDVPDAEAAEILARF